MEPQFSALDDGTGLEVVDPIEGVRVVLPTPEEVTPVESDPDLFAQPVSTACKITASRLEVNGDGAVTLHDSTDGQLVDQFSHLTSRTLSSDTHLLGVNTKLNLYVHLDGEITVETNTDRTRFDFEG